ncbi:hypothetical protein UY3_11867 [Chelonia mydas]|uniref:Uncharacterized protein n=1 Tax=Chelonia mydas TaxID=8469 RepID=M7AZL7_CHEMY|nr:hypothetical protein UY3_11867 [Chelonia mydas]
MDFPCAVLKSMDSYIGVFVALFGRLLMTIQLAAEVLVTYHDPASNEQDMKDRGHNRDPMQCNVKLKELRQAYQKTREANGRSGS